MQSILCCFHLYVADAVTINPSNGDITLPSNLVADAWVSMQFEVTFEALFFRLTTFDILLGNNTSVSREPCGRRVERIFVLKAAIFDK